MTDSDKSEGKPRRKHGRGSVYRRKVGTRWVWWLAYRVAGERVYESTDQGDRRLAEAMLTQRMREIADGSWQRPLKGKAAAVAARTVSDDWADWLKTRDDVKSLATDVSMGKLHILPTRVSTLAGKVEFGSLKTADVEASHILDLFTELRRKTGAHGKPLSKSTIHGINSRLVTFFADMEIRKAIARTPYAGLRRSQKPRKPSRHELEAVKRTFTEAELSLLMFDERVPYDRRVLYAVQFLTGTRFGEAAGFYWSNLIRNDATRCGHCNREARKLSGPAGLDALCIDHQYVNQPLKGKRNEPGAPRTAPVHPMLASILADWQLKGFPMLFGRSPQPTDYIVPSRMGRCRSLARIAQDLYKDCAAVGIAVSSKRTAQTHAFRRAFKTIAEAHGGGTVWIERILHNASGDVAAGYLADSWPALCRAVQCIPVTRPQLAEVRQLRAASGTRSRPEVGKNGYATGYASPNASKTPEKQGVFRKSLAPESSGNPQNSRESSGPAPSEPITRGPENPAASTFEVQTVTHVTNAPAPASDPLAAALRAALSAVEAGTLSDAARSELAQLTAALSGAAPVTPTSTSTTTQRGRKPRK